jgi:hypothetical protein
MTLGDLVRHSPTRQLSSPDRGVGIIVSASWMDVVGDQGDLWKCYVLWSCGIISKEDAYYLDLVGRFDE